MALTSRATHVLQWAVQWVAISRGGANPKKAVLSSDRSLQLDSVKLESLVIADQHAAVNTFPGLVHTARHAMEVGGTRSHYLNPEQSGMEVPKVNLMTGAKS